MNRRALSSSLMLLVLVSLPLVAQVPDGTLGFSYRKLEDGKPGDAVRQVTLSCQKGTCVMQTLVLNECVGGVFYPKLESAISGSGGFTVTSRKPGNLLIQQGFGEAAFRIHLNYVDDHGLRVTDVSGEFVNFGMERGDVVAWRISALRGADRKVTLGCPALVQGPAE